MIAFPNAKINLGLQVLRKREDQYHELETVFYPLEICDVLEVVESGRLSFSVSGIQIDGEPEKNICVQAYHLLANDFELPPVEIHLHKRIPIGAGLGGGSSDAAFMLKLLNEKFDLRIGTQVLEGYARQLGADCAFFIQNQPVFATGIGADFSPISVNLSGYHFAVVKPPVHISSGQAYQWIQPEENGRKLAERILLPLEEWRKYIVNDFEKGIFKLFPEIAEVKDWLYDSGAIYAAMSGSGSSVFGIFKDLPVLTAYDDRLQVFTV